VFLKIGEKFIKIGKNGVFRRKNEDIYGHAELVSAPHMQSRHFAILTL
jgi:hypothetical protein